MPWWRYLAWFIALLVFTWWYLLSPADGDAMVLSYSDFKASVMDDQVARVKMQGDRISGEFHQARTPDAGQMDPKIRFVTTLPPVTDPDLIALLERHRVEIHAVSGEVHWLAKAIIGVLPWLLIIGLFWFATGRLQSAWAISAVRACSTSANPEPNAFVSRIPN